MKHSVTKVTAIILSLCVLAILSIWIFLIYKSSALSSEITLIAEQARSRTSQSLYASTIRNTLRDSKDELAIIENRFVSEDGVPDFISMLEDKAAQVGVRTDFGTINVEPARDESPYPRLRLKMSGSGKWEKIVGFVSTIDSLPYVTRIENVSFVKMGTAEEKTSTTTWSFNLELVQFIKEKK